MSDDLVAQIKERRLHHMYPHHLDELLNEAATALTEARAEIERQADWIRRLQTALMFWMPGVDTRLDGATRELAADDASLLAGYNNTTDKPCWGDGMIDRAVLAESELSTLRAELDASNANHRQMATTMADLARKHNTLRARVREVVGPFASTDLLECKDCVDNDGKHYQSQWLADALRAARQLMEDVK